MSNLARSVLFVIVIPTGFAHSSTSIAQPSETKTQAPARTNVEGNFAHYLESSDGEINGIVLEDGTVARFAPSKRMAQSKRFGPGDSLRVTGDVVSGLEGPYLVHASVTRINVPTLRGAVSPSPVGSSGNGSRLRRAGKGAKDSLNDSSQVPRATGKTHGPSADRTGKVDNLLIVDKSSVRARKKGRLENIESKASEATTGRGRNSSYSQWSRSQETAGP